VLLANIFDAKVIYTQVKPNAASGMFLQYWSVELFEVSMSRQMFLKEFVGDYSCLWQSIHSFSNLHVDIAIGYFFIWHLYVLISIQWCLEVHVLDVGTDKAGTFGADENIP
jgi:hypothetical protein